MRCAATKAALPVLRLRSTLVFAVAVHLPLLAFVRPGPRAATPSLETTEIVVETTIEHPPTAEAPMGVVAAPRDTAKQGAPGPSIRHDAAGHAAPPVTPADSGEAVSAGVTTPVAIADVWSGGKAPSIELPRGFVGSSPPPTTSAETPPRPAAETALRAALDADDRAKGLGRSGPLVSTAHDVAMASRIPVNGAAILVAVVDAEGKVVDVRASLDDSAWRDLAASLRRAMEAKRIRVPPGTRGLEVALRIESRVRTAAGHVRREDDRGGHGWVDAEHPDRARPPSLALGTPTYRCLEACTASGNIDPTDALLGATAKATRTIAVQTLSEKRL